MPRLDIAKARQAGFTSDQIASYAKSKGVNLYDSTQTQATQQAQTPAAKQSNPLVDLLPLIGSIGGGFLGTPLGPAGIIAGSAAGGGGGEFLKQKFSGEETNLGKVGQETLLGGGGSLVGLGAGRLLGGIGSKLLSKGAQAASQTAGEATTQGGLKAAANKLAAKEFGSAFDVPQKLAERLKFQTAVEEVIADGKIPFSAGGLKKMVNTLTGDTGAFTKAQRVGASGIQTSINYDNVLQSTGELLKTSGLNTKQIKDTMNTARAFFNGVKPVRPGALSGEESYEVIRKLEKKGYELFNRGTNVQNPDFLSEQQGKALLGIAEDLQGQIGRAVDTEGIFPIIKQELLDSLSSSKDIGPGVLEKISNAQNFGTLRSLASPYVRLNKGFDFSASRANAPFNQASARIGSSLAGAGLGFGVGGPLGAVGGAVAAPVVQGIAEASRLPLAAGAARAIQGAGNLAGGAGTLLPQVGGQVGVRALNQPQSQQQPQLSESNESPTDALTSEATGIPDDRALRTAFAAAILKNPKQASAIKAAFDLIGAGDNKPKSVTAAQRQDLGKQGLRSLKVVKAELRKDPNVVVKQLVPGTYLSRQFDSALQRTVEVLLRLRTGASAPETEVRRYMNQLGPRFGDSPEVIKTKLEDLELALQDAAKTSGGVGDLPLPQDYSSLLLGQ